MADIDIPQEYWIHLNPLHVTGGMDLDVDAQLTADLGLDDVNIAVEPLKLTLDPLKLTLDPVKLTLDPVTVDLGLDNVNVCLSLAITDFPRMRVHAPTKYDFGLCVLGLELLKFSVCGETMLLTEENPPRISGTVGHREADNHSTRADDQSERATAMEASGDEPFRVSLGDEATG